MRAWASFKAHKSIPTCHSVMRWEKILPTIQYRCLNHGNRYQVCTEYSICILAGKLANGQWRFPATKPSVPPDPCRLRFQHLMTSSREVSGPESTSRRMDVSNIEFGVSPGKEKISSYPLTRITMECFRLYGCRSDHRMTLAVSP